jgi:iron complex outermembrane receptor protein
LTLGQATLTPRLNYGYVGPRWNYIGYGDGDRLAGRGLLSALLTLQKDAWRIEAWGTNLADKSYVSGRSGDNEFYGAPREYGLRLGINF